MHEMSIAVELISQLETVAAENRLVRIRQVSIRAGVLRAIVPEALELAFSEAARGGVAQGASLKLEIVPARAKCRQCGREFEPTVDSYLCRDCNQADVDLVAGNEILLTSVEGDAAGED